MHKVIKFCYLIRDYRTFGMKITIFQLSTEMIKYAIYSKKVSEFSFFRKLFLEVIKKKDEYVQKWIELKFLPVLNQIEDEELNVENFDNIIWTMWLQGTNEMPEIVNLCHQSVQKNRGDFEHILLTKENLHKYIDIPKHILLKWEKGIIGNAHFSDYVRIAILEKYGGVWLDSTILLNQPLSLKYLTKYPQFHVKGLKNFKNDFLYFESHNWGSYFLSRLGETKFYTFLRKCLDLYWQEFDKDIDYLFLNHLAYLGRSRSQGMNLEFQTIPANNTEAENLYQILEESYTDTQYFNVVEKSNTYIFKLNHRHKMRRIINNEETIYSQLLRNYCDQKTNLRRDKK